MKQTYHIEGVKCLSCVAKITDAIKHAFSATAIVIHDKNTLSFYAEKSVTLSELNALLNKTGDYRVSERVINKEEVSAGSYKPIYIIFGYLILVSILVNIKHASIQLLMADFMAGFFLVFSFFKMLDISGFAIGFSNYDLIARKFYSYGYIYPFIELAFGVFYLVSPESIYLNFIVFLVMLISTLGVVASKLSKQQFQCACVGTFLKVPLGSIAIIEDLLMVVMSLFMLLSVY